MALADRMVVMESGKIRHRTAWHFQFHAANDRSDPRAAGIPAVSDFAVVLAFVHLYSLFMVVPIFNSMMRIDRALLAAAADCGASGWQVVKEVVIPLSKPGMAMGSIFVVTLVMGDFVPVRLMSGGQSASVGLILKIGMAKGASITMAIDAMVQATGWTWSLTADPRSVP
jgi:ABC-type spermidine/putrescine transport system permease subunit I